MEIELDTWTVPGDSRDVLWGEGLAASADGGPAVFLRFYEWNVFGFATDTRYNRADKEQVHRAAAPPYGTSGEITYPAHGVELFARVEDRSVALRLRVENRTERDWGPAAGLIPCLNPGRRPDDEPVTPELADSDREHTYYPGDGGLTTLEDGRIHWHADRYDHVERHRPSGGFSTENSPWNEEAPGRVAEALLLRESDDGEWVTGIGWEAGLCVDAHNPWQCLHLGVPVGPLAAGERTEIRGRLYLERGDPEKLLERYREEFQ